MPIPRRIIQTQRDPAIQQDLRDGWMASHPDYEYLFFDDAACRDLVASAMPGLVAVYDALPLPVQRADLFRYVAVHELGGLYVDVDTVCRAPLHDYVDLSQEAMVVCPEMVPTDWPQGFAGYLQRFCIPHQLAQWAFCAPPGHPALAMLVDRIRYFVSRFSRTELQAASQHAFFTLELTGPRVFTHVMNEYLSGSRTGAMTMLPRRAWAAWPWEHQVSPLPGDIRLTHLFSSAWWPSKQAASARPRPRPPSVKFDLRY
ncbi:MAG: hypothetical protein KA795_05835 [Burkholderiaceae bacterium]|nr:hypothetical protein [Burkholderiaceae bacterium]